MKLKQMLSLAILAPSLFVVGLVAGSYWLHRPGMLTHIQEHVAMAAIAVVGIVGFSYLMLRTIHDFQGRILSQNDELSARTREMSALLKVGRAVEESNDIDKVAPASLEAVMQATNAATAEVWLADSSAGTVVLRYRRDAAGNSAVEQGKHKLDDGYARQVMQTGKPVLQRGSTTLYAQPLHRGRGTVGVLAVVYSDPHALAGEAVTRLLELMAEHIAIAIENAQLHEEVRTLATLTERERLAREMHDGLAQVLGYVNTKAQAVKELLKSNQVGAAVGQMEQLEAAAQETYDDVREAILALGSNGRRRPMVESLQEYVRRFTEFSGLEVQLVVEGTPYSLNPGAEVQLLRIVQEALANARKHAHPNRVRVVLHFDANGYRLLVEDDGRGFDSSAPHRGPRPRLGLQSIRERASAVGAKFTLDTAPGRGTRIIVEIPRVSA